MRAATGDPGAHREGGSGGARGTRAEAQRRGLLFRFNRRADTTATQNRRLNVHKRIFASAAELESIPDDELEGWTPWREGADGQQWYTNVKSEGFSRMIRGVKDAPPRH